MILEARLLLRYSLNIEELQKKILYYSCQRYLNGFGKDNLASLSPNGMPMQTYDRSSTQKPRIFMKLPSFLGMQKVGERDQRKVGQLKLLYSNGYLLDEGDNIGVNFLQVEQDVIWF
ncbi:MAG: hypothetical protein EZS28_036325 [Streblomastix strix]|uniref:Uncharacterized protein n=1 Tax=Streblomastix strix TaxID=222440 RepID=A0A5J4UD69_9EUKA|nr:MAG: hypothetical protein EZS28_036325 [Streblomastix strix]